MQNPLTHILKFFPDLPFILSLLDGDKGASKIVGGAVRNALLNTIVDDVDIATILTPDEVIECAKKASIQALPTGIEHGTITLIHNHIPYEITTLRKDISTDGRRATIAFTQNFEEDAKRRDFTMNALYLDSKGQITDYFGGIDDLQARRVKFIGNVNERVEEDYLRIIRYFRFTCIYGGHYDETVLQSFKHHQKGLKALSGNRIGNEIIKMLKAPQQKLLRALSYLTKYELLEHIINIKPHLQAITLDKSEEPLTPLVKFTLLVLSITQNEADIKKLLDFWAVPKKLKIILQHLDIIHNSQFKDGNFFIKSLLFELSERKLPLDYAKEFAIIACVLNAQELANVKIDESLLPIFPIKPKELMERGFHKQDLGKKLKFLKSKWQASEFTLSKNELLDML